MKYKSFLQIWLIGLAALAMSIWSIKAETIDLEADSYMPYTGDSDKGELGFMVEIAKTIWEKQGNTVTYTTKAWKDALQDSASGVCTAVVGANRDDAPGYIYPTVEQGEALGTFYSLTSSDWKFTSTTSLETICLGIVSDYKYGPELSAYIAANRSDNKRIYATQSDLGIIQKFVDSLKTKRIQAFVEDRNVVGYFLKSYDRPDIIQEAGSLKTPTKLYIAISPHELNAAVLAKQLSDGMAQIRESGELSAILAKYGVTDWAAK